MQAEYIKNWCQNLVAFFNPTYVKLGNITCNCHWQNTMLRERQVQATNTGILLEIQIICNHSVFLQSQCAFPIPVTSKKARNRWIIFSDHCCQRRCFFSWLVTIFLAGYKNRQVDLDPESDQNFQWSALPCWTVARPLRLISWFFICKSVWIT